VPCAAGRPERRDASPAYGSRFESLCPRGRNSAAGTSWPRRASRVDARLLDTHTELQVATLLNERGFRGDREILFTGYRVARIRDVYKLKSRRRRLLDQGFAPLNVLRRRFQVSQSTIRNWWLQGLLPRRYSGSKVRCLHGPPQNLNELKLPAKGQCTLENRPPIKTVE